ncbi:histidinol-phosphatase (PHP family) [Sporobacter termitidis DSM 10068]|uniref:Histidinol-phosphatase n=1 Tax=Sporobacter termitidis DSM 10068 TaxID=1123282 RepID=A0A1M5VRD8_9FIRM|nr:histidinol-phosphatase HisJ family protein [Sporobacter termitidis]SHH77534.1 histidinol-phosphatase (PHP family) [Sporobacter termitidis DSM 10068]
MTLLTNFHAHSTFCDGTETPEDMVRAAIGKGCAAFGISGHAPMAFDTDWCMTAAGERDFVREMDRLKAVYGGRLTLMTGVERDYYSPEPAGVYDYVIGSVHYIKKDGAMLTVDESEDAQRRDAARYYAGDFYTYARDYFRTVAGVAPATKPDFIGHFDLVAKFNDGGRLFDEADPRYTGPALEALAAVAETCGLFEINTGAMYRVGRSVPYPAPFLLRALRERGGEIILSSDSHDGASIGYRFAEAAELAKACGFEYAKTLTPSGAETYKL